MSAQVGQEIKGLMAMKGDKGVVLAIGSGVYENCLKVKFNFYGECWISGNNGEDAEWVEQEVVAEAPVVEEGEKEESVARKIQINYLRASDLPAFINGSEAQKKFAQSIRLDCLNKFMGQMERRRQEWSVERYAQLDRVYRSVMCSHASPNFWIDNRARIDEVVFAEIIARIKKEGPVK